MPPEWHPYDAFNFLVTAWHLFHDWKNSDETHALSRIKRNKVRLPDEMNLILDVTRDLVNGSKHFQLTPKAASNRRVDEVHTGKEVGFYSYFFHERLPAVTVDGHWYFSIRVLSNFLMAYFEWVFDDSIEVKRFPKNIIEGIRYCNIAERSGPTPDIWLLNVESKPEKKPD